MSRRLLLQLALGLCLTVAACGGGAGAASPPAQKGGGGTTLNVVGKDIVFEQKELTAPANQQVTVNLKNVGALEHSIIFDLPPTNDRGGDQGIPNDWAAGKGIAAGKSASLTFTTPAAGTYRYYCAVPGHTEAGMVGTLTVK